MYGQTQIKFSDQVTWLS